MTSTFASRTVLRGSALTVWAMATLWGCQVASDAPANVVRDPKMDAGPETPDASTPCEVAFGEACNANCKVDGDCHPGLHCASERCTADCFANHECPTDYSCSAAGRCIKADGIFLDPAMTDPTDPTLPPECIEGQVEFKAVIPQVWLLLDRSGSMSGTLSGTTTRWVALGNVLFGDPALPDDRGVVGAFADRMAFGAVFFTDSSGCVLQLESVGLAANNYRHIRERYNKLAPSGGTPTAESIAATVAVAATSDLTGGPKLLVLATDGVPGGCAPSTGVPDTQKVENEVTQAFLKDIKTFAISISTGTDSAHMQRVANLGVGLAANATPAAPLYTATNQDDLKSAFSTILTALPRSCVFSLNGTVEAENADQGTIVLNGQTLTYKDPNGWILKQPDEVELTGTACTQLQEGDDDLKINFPCAVFTPVVK
jgi:hypothetical protein